MVDSNSINWNPILLALIAGFFALGSTAMTYMLGRLAASQKEISTAVTQVHGVVNSNQTAMQTKLDALTAEVLKLSGANAVLLESKRVSEITAAVAVSKAETLQAAPASAPASASSLVLPTTIKIDAGALPIPVTIDDKVEPPK